MKVVKKFILVIASVLALTGCEDFLNPKQVNLIYNDVFWNTQADAEVGLAGVYSLYRGLMVNPDNWYNRCDATTGFIKSGWNGGSSSRLYVYGVFNDPNNDNKMWGSLEGMADWSNHYKVVSQVNLVIDRVEKIPEDKFATGAKQRILGEAYFLRALTYFNIVKVWGNAPLVVDVIESSGQVINEELVPVTVPRNHDLEICAQVLKDVQLAVDYLDWGTPGSATWGIFANKGSALALQGHANLWMNFITNRDKRSEEMIELMGEEVMEPKQYIKNAITALNTIRTEGNYSYAQYTEEGVKALYKGGSSEAIFELNINPDANESYRADVSGVTRITCKMVPTDGDVKKDRSESVNFVPSTQKLTIYPEYDWENNTGDDIRPNLFFDAWSSEYKDPISDTSTETNDRTKVTWLTKYNQFILDTYADQDEYTPYFAVCNIPVFRYTDAMLMLAEAYAKDNKDAQAIEIIDEIRSRAGLKPYSGKLELMDEIMTQRCGELFGEGYLYHDFVRNNWFPNDFLMPQLNYKQEAYYWPVASKILSKNWQIQQTPFWNGKTQW